MNFYHQCIKIPPLTGLPGLQAKNKRTVDLRKLSEVRECNVVITKVVMRLTHPPISSFAWNTGHLNLFYICFLVIVLNVPLMVYGKKCWPSRFLKTQTYMYHMLVYTAGRLFILLF